MFLPWCISLYHCCSEQLFYVMVIMGSITSYVLVSFAFQNWKTSSHLWDLTQDLLSMDTLPVATFVHFWLQSFEKLLCKCMPFHPFPNKKQNPHVWREKSMWSSDWCQVSPSTLKEHFCVVIFLPKATYGVIVGTPLKLWLVHSLKTREEWKINKFRNAEKKESLK